MSSSDKREVTSRACATLRLNRLKPNRDFDIIFPNAMILLFYSPLMIFGENFNVLYSSTRKDILKSR